MTSVPFSSDCISFSKFITHSIRLPSLISITYQIKPPLYILYHLNSTIWYKMLNVLSGENKAALLLRDHSLGASGLWMIAPDKTSLLLQQQFKPPLSHQHTFHPCISAKDICIETSFPHFKGFCITHIQSGCLTMCLL